jgi:hypothetical protein
MESPDTPLETKYLLMTIASNVHKKYVLTPSLFNDCRMMKDAVNGKGVDRHLFGMKVIHTKEIGGDLPAIYQDPAFSRALHHK